MEEYEAANEWIRKRLNLPTAKNSLEISRDFEAKLRAQAFFSARVAESRILDRLRRSSPERFRRVFPRGNRTGGGKNAAQEVSPRRRQR